MRGPKETTPESLSGAAEVQRVALDQTPAHRARTHVRSALVLVALAIVLVGVVYPWVVTGIAQVTTPGSANGSLIYENGTVVGSWLVGQNVSHLNLFWDRPSMNDYNTTVAVATNISGPSDPALLVYLNETIAYMVADWNWSANVTLPFDLVSPSYSGFDPYVAPAGVLIQVSRVAGAIHNDTHASFNDLVHNLTALVNQYIEQPLGGFVGTAIVNVMRLDVALMQASWWG